MLLDIAKAFYRRRMSRTISSAGFRPVLSMYALANADNLHRHHTLLHSRSNKRCPDNELVLTPNASLRSLGGALSSASSKSLDATFSYAGVFFVASDRAALSRRSVWLSEVRTSKPREGS
jgi:hypothetical protein